MEIPEKTNPFFAFVMKNFLHLFVVFIFLIAIFWHYFVVPPEAVKKEAEGREKAIIIKPDLDEDHGEKVFSHIFQSQAGDVFRIGSQMKAKENAEVEIFVRSPLNEVVKVGTWQLETSENGEYNELLYRTAQRYEDVIVRLKSTPEGAGKDWYDPEVSIRSLFVTRVEASGEEAASLMPTFYGISALKKQEVFSLKERKKPSNHLEWVFQAEGDYLQALEFFGETNRGGRQEYIFELYRYNSEKKEKDAKIIKKASFILDELDDFRISTGNYSMPFTHPLKQGQWYTILLTRGQPDDPKSFFTIYPLEAVNNDSEYKERADLALQSGIRFRPQNNTSLLDGARVEDRGNGLLYSFSLLFSPVDYLNLYEASSGIFYDREKKQVVGKQRGGEFFIYRFDTVYPYETFAFRAIQDGDDGKEIKVEYSLDNILWGEVPFIQETPGSHRFELALPGNGKSRVVYVRASYDAEEKTSGFFGFKELSANASLPRSR